LIVQQITFLANLTLLDIVPLRLQAVWIFFVELAGISRTNHCEVMDAFQTDCFRAFI